MTTFNPFGAQTYNLGTSIGSTDTTILLSSFLEPVTNIPYTMVLLNTDIVYATIAPKTTSSEFISFTGITQNVNGSATLTGVTRGLAKKYPFTTDAAYKLPHSGQTQFIISDVPQVFQEYVSVENDVTIDGIKTFTTSPTIPTATVTDIHEAASIEYVNNIALAGAPDASTTVKGVTKLSVAPALSTNPIAVGTNDGRVPTQAENDAMVGNNIDQAVGTGNKFVTQTGLIHSAENYAASAAGTDTYAVTLSPVPTSYTNGFLVRFKADVGNTGAATLNVNTLGAITIKKNNDQDLQTGDIEANQIIEVVYNSTGPVFQMQTPSAISGVADIQTFLASGTWTKPTGAKKVFIQAWGGGGSGGKGNSTNATGAGGGEYRETWLDASSAGTTETVTIGAGGAAKTVSGSGNDGADTTFGSLAIAKGGGGGSAPGSSDTSGSNGGTPFVVINGLYGGGVSAAIGQSGLYSAAGGGFQTSTNTGFNGGNSYYGGAGGAGAGDSVQGTGGTSTKGGNGGNGTKNTVAGSGAQPGGGGGGVSSSGNSGAGGDGKMIVTTFF